MARMPKQDLEKDLQDPEYVKLYGAALAKTEFAVTLGKARHNCGLTQEQLATKLGRSQPYVAKLESGDANPTLGTIGSLLAVQGLRLVTHTEPLLSYRATSSPMPNKDRNIIPAKNWVTLPFPGEGNRNLAAAESIMKIPGQTVMTFGEGKGKGGALEAADKAMFNPLLNISIVDAKVIQFIFTAGPRITLEEVNAAGEYIASKVDPNAIIYFGMVSDDALEDRVRITIIAAGIPEATLRKQEAATPSEGVEIG